MGAQKQTLTQMLSLTFFPSITTVFTLKSTPEDGIENLNRAGLKDVWLTYRSGEFRIKSIVYKPQKKAAVGWLVSVLVITMHDTLPGLSSPAVSDDQYLQVYCIH